MIGAAALLVLGAALVSIVGLRTPSPAERTSQLESELRCPVCQGLSIADSPAELAGEMRTVVAQQVSAGATDAEVRAHFVERYGQWILLAPDSSGLDLLVWAVPGVLLVLGATAVAIRSRRLKREFVSEASPRAAIERPRPLLIVLTGAIIIAAVAVPLGVASGTRARGGQITGGQAAGEAAPTIEELQARVAADPTDVGMLVALGDAYAGAGRNADGADTYGRALKLAPDDVGALVGLSSLLLGAGRPEAALQLANRAVTVAPGLPDAYFFRAIASYQVAGSLTPFARADILRFLDLAPDDPRRALARQLLGRPGPTGGP